VTFGEFFWWMLAVTFWFMLIWVFIAVIADIFRRDISGGAKAGWILLVIVFPLFGSLIYVLARPKMTAEDVADLAAADAARRGAAGYSTADELEKLARLREQGTISGEEFESLRLRAIAH
jgi:hypothetical protein